MPVIVGTDKIFTHETLRSGVVRVSFNLLNLFEDLGINVNNDKIKERLQQAVGDVTTHFASFNCPPDKHILLPAPPKPSGEGEEPTEGGAGGAEEIPRIRVDKCWKMHVIDAGLSGLVGEMTMFKGTFRGAGMYDTIGPAPTIKVSLNTEYAFYLMYTVHAFLGTVEATWNEKSGMWEVKPNQDEDKQVAVSPGCLVSEGQITSESCGFDTVSGTLKVFASIRILIDASADLQIDSDGIVTDFNADAHIAAQSVTARGYVARLPFLHTPYESKRLTST